MVHSGYGCGCRCGLLGMFLVWGRVVIVCCGWRHFNSKFEIFIVK